MSQNVLSRNQKRALAVLLEYPTVTEAAEACGLTTKTLSRYMADPVFRSELANLERDLIDEAGRMLFSGQLEALQTLSQLIKNGENESTRRLAAATWMDLSQRWRDSKIEQRLANLEAAILNGQH